MRAVFGPSVAAAAPTRRRSACPVRVCLARERLADALWRDASARGALTWSSWTSHLADLAAPRLVGALERAVRRLAHERETVTSESWPLRVARVNSEGGNELRRARPRSPV